jgi:hypothetical protein
MHRSWVPAPLRRSGTIRGYESHLKRITPLLGPIRLRKLTAQDLDRAYRSWLGEGLSATTVHHHHAVISAALRLGPRRHRAALLWRRRSLVASPSGPFMRTKSDSEFGHGLRPA